MVTNLIKHSSASLRDVMRPVMMCSSRSTVSSVADVFTKNPSLLLIPLTQDDRFVGVVSRKELFSRHLARKYAAELYGNKPIELLIESRPLSMSPDLDVNSALRLLLEFDPSLEVDAFPLLEGDACAGVVHVAELIMEISRGQAHLLEMLELLSERIRREVDMARQIQQGLLPPSPYQFNGLRLDALLINSSEISGDVYDYHRIDDSRLMVMVGDVSGHGVQSGMVATAAKAGLHLLLERGVTTPSELLDGMNRAVIETASDALMMTAIVVVLDTNTRSLSYANAGHNYPFLMRPANGVPAVLDQTGGFPLGFDAGSQYREVTTEFFPDDLLLLYSDGIVEARNGSDEEYGDDRLRLFLAKVYGRDPHGIIVDLVETVRGHSGSESFEDDVTLLIVGPGQGGAA